MANWCDNRVRFGAKDPAVIAEIKKAALSDGFFSYYVASDGTTLGNADAWGTKWDVSSDDIQITDADPHRIDMVFSTAWSPPISFYDALIDKYTGNVAIDATFCEPGVGVIGTYEDGVAKEYYLTDANLPARLREEYADLLADLNIEDEGTPEKEKTVC